jgi:integrase/recombinase XerD
MFERLFRSDAARRRHRDAPFAVERECYLQHCADLGVTHATLRQKSTELLWIARLLDKNAARQSKTGPQRQLAIHLMVEQAHRRGRPSSPQPPEAVAK